MDPSSPTHHHYLHDEQLVEFATGTNTLTHHMKLLELFLIVIMSLFGLGGIIFQSVANRRHDSDLRRIKETLDREWEVSARWKDSTKDELARHISEEIDKALAEKLATLIAERYEKHIFDWVTSYTQDVLMQTPKARGTLAARLRRLIQDLAPLLHAHNKKSSQEVQRALANGIQDWYTLGLLFTSDLKHLETGLHHFRANPFPEGRERLVRLRQRYKDEPRFVPLIEKALHALEG